LAEIVGCVPEMLWALFVFGCVCVCVCVCALAICMVSGRNKPCKKRWFGCQCVTRKASCILSFPYTYAQAL
jgi:hypothetical protein